MTDIEIDQKNFKNFTIYPFLKDLKEDKYQTNRLILIIGENKNYPSEI